MRTNPLHIQTLRSAYVAVQETTLKARLGLRNQPFIFNDPGLAQSFADRCHKPHVVVLWECPQFLVVCPSDAARLVKAGYEILPR